MKRRSTPAMNVGISLLVLVFVNLCLVTFGVLSLQNAQADRQMSRKAAEHTREYYEAVNNVQMQIRDNQKLLKRLSRDVSFAKEPAKYEEEIKKEFAGKADYEMSEEGECLFHYVCPVSDRQELSAVVRQKEDEQGSHIEITQWNLQAAGTWEADRSMKLYQGTENQDKEIK